MSAKRQPFLSHSLGPQKQFQPQAHLRGPSVGKGFRQPSVRPRGWATWHLGCSAHNTGQLGGIRRGLQGGLHKCHGNCGHIFCAAVLFVPASEEQRHYTSSECAPCHTEPISLAGQGLGGTTQESCSPHLSPRGGTPGTQPAPVSMSSPEQPPAQPPWTAHCLAPGPGWRRCPQPGTQIVTLCAQRLQRRRSPVPSPAPMNLPRKPKAHQQLMRSEN